jgi:hypothetical protein
MNGTPSSPQSFSVSAPNSLLPKDGFTCDPLLDQQIFPSAANILRWIEEHAEHVFIQQILSGRRQKNRVILEFRRRGVIAAVGGVTLRHAVQRAQARLLATPAAEEVKNA